VEAGRPRTCAHPFDSRRVVHGQVWREDAAAHGPPRTGDQPRRHSADAL